MNCLPLSWNKKLSHGLHTPLPLPLSQPQLCDMQGGAGGLLSACATVGDMSNVQKAALIYFPICSFLSACGGMRFNGKFQGITDSFRGPGHEDLWLCKFYKISLSDVQQRCCQAAMDGVSKEREKDGEHAPESLRVTEARPRALLVQHNPPPKRPARDLSPL